MQVILEMEHSETHQVVGAGVDRGTAAMIKRIERNGPLLCIVALSGVGFETRTNAHRSMRQPERHEDFGTHVIGVIAAGSPGDDVIYYSVTQVRILPRLARRGDAHPVMSHPLLHPGQTPS